MMNTKAAIKQFSPPIVWNIARDIARRRKLNGRFKQGPSGEQPADWYDASLNWAPHFLKHYTESGYYFLWTVIADRLRRPQAQFILDVGCGTGQFAALLRDNGVERYVGFDFSPRRIEAAQRACPEFEFHVADAFQTDLFECLDYDAVISLEFLEHVERDTDVIDRIRPGTRFLGSVPNFRSTSHVRHFDNADDVYRRYEPQFHELSVVPVIKNTARKTFFLIEGVRR